METRQRSILKAVIWTLVGFVMMSGIGYAMTGSLTLGGSMAILNSVIGLASYVLYERIWATISWGRDV